MLAMRAKSIVLAVFVASVFASVASVFGSDPRPIHQLGGSTIRPGEIDETITRLMHDAEVTGLGVAIFNHGKLAWLKTYGFRDKERDLPLTPDSVLTAASLSKSEFAYLVMQFVGEGRLDLDKPVVQYLSKPLPEYPAYADLANDRRYERITSRMLLDHTGGFPNIRFLNRDRKLNINFDPGSRFAYSGEGIQLLQLVIETISGKPLQQLMQERVFQPLGMTRTSMISEARFDNNYANAYDEWGVSLGHQNRTEAQAAGSMQTTLGDTAKFLQAVIDGRGLKSAAREQMLSPQIRIHSRRQFPTLSPETTDKNDAIQLSYGLGWGLYWSPQGKAFFKGGHDDGFRHYMIVFDKSKDGIIIMSNSSNGEAIFKDILETIQRNTFTPIEWEGYQPYNAPHTEVAADGEQLGRLAGRYADADFVLTVGPKDGHLEISRGGVAHAFYAERPNRFFSRNLRVTVGFAPGRMIVHYTDNDFTLMRESDAGAK